MPQQHRMLQAETLMSQNLIRASADVDGHSVKSLDDRNRGLIQELVIQRISELFMILFEPKDGFLRHQEEKKMIVRQSLIPVLYFVAMPISVLGITDNVFRFALHIKRKEGVSATPWLAVI